MTVIRTMDQLETLYGAPAETATAKVTDRLIPEYRALIEASPFMALATAGPEGLDCSPRGDRGQVVRIADDRTLLIPDRRGNNRVDSLRNIVRDGRVALLFLIPGSGTTFRVNGTAVLSVDPDLLEGFRMDGALPRSVIVVTVAQAYFQCARAVVRADLWNPALHADPAHLPSPGRILATLSEGRVGGEPYDRDWPTRAAASLW
ncbi:MAG: hypothetical protein RLY86_1085 [Pseudomonadota bacterium]|jgi:PPOX class probable FMN-dependent enzyme